MKTNKAYKKRLKVTKNGKVLSRKAGQNHFNAKESRSTQHAKAGFQPLHMNQKAKSRYLSGI
jgi:ribosomal protein L35